MRIKNFDLMERKIGSDIKHTPERLSFENVLDIDGVWTPDIFGVYLLPLTVSSPQTPGHNVGQIINKLTGPPRDGLEIAIFSKSRQNYSLITYCKSYIFRIYRRRGSLTIIFWEFLFIEKGHRELL